MTYATIVDDIIDIRDYNVALDGVTDDSAGINRAFEEAARRGGASVYFPKAKGIAIKSPIIVQTTAIKILTETSYKTRITALTGFEGAALLYFKQSTADPNTIFNTGINIDGGIDINCNNANADGILVENGYDKVSFRNVSIMNLHYNHSGFNFVTEPNKLGQTILLENSTVTRVKKETALKESHVSENDLLGKACYYFKKYQEINLIGCKGFANHPNDMIEPNIPRIGTAFEYEDCRGVNMAGCSAAFANTAISFKAVTREAIGLTVSAQTNERITGNALITEGSGNLKCKEIMVLPIRGEAAMNDGGSGEFHLKNTIMSTIYSLTQKVALEEMAIQNLVISDDMTKVSMVENNNSVLGVSSYPDYIFKIRDAAQIEGNLNPKLALKSDKQKYRMALEDSTNALNLDRHTEGTAWKTHLSINSVETKLNNENITLTADGIMRIKRATNPDLTLESNRQQYRMMLMDDAEKFKLEKLNEESGGRWDEYLSVAPNDTTLTNVELVLNGHVQAKEGIAINADQAKGKGVVLEGEDHKYRLSVSKDGLNVEQQVPIGDQLFSWKPIFELNDKNIKIINQTVKTTDFNLQSVDGEYLARLLSNPANSYTGLAIRYRADGQSGFAQVQVGQRDSAGLGKRALYIPN
ncbi:MULTISPECIES: glycosyl hydrolase family 28-related protein [unclassified Listeria]|uniref:glycosyl hydrolase family 28-related protein n=2 Tax=Listeria TaxID=1637 RepID=UPI000B589E99|nr:MULTISPECIES: glycosyl hydrolase family 28-related protein [unclassified Listeria]